MSGHSKWSTIKRKKGAADAKRGQLFTKLIKEITISARIGGEDVNANTRLRVAINKAKVNNMPNENIERAIKKGLGTLEGETYEEVRYEGYGPGGVAIMLDCLTDNKNRTTPEIRTLFNKNNSNLGETGCVNYLFDKKGIIIIDGKQTDEDTIIELLMDYAIDDVKTEDKTIVITTKPDGYNEVYDVLKGKEYTIVFNDITYIPKSTVPLDEKKGGQCLKLIELLEDHEDVQNVYSNYDISEEVMMRISEAQ